MTLDWTLTCHVCQQKLTMCCVSSGGTYTDAQKKTNSPPTSPWFSGLRVPRGSIYIANHQRNRERATTSSKICKQQQQQQPWKQCHWDGENLKTLERRIIRLVLFYKSLHGQTALPSPYHYVRADNNTRGLSDIFTQVPTRTQVSANSFFNRTIENWNRLSEPVCLQSLWTLL